MALKQWILGVVFVIHVSGGTGIDYKVYSCTDIGGWKDVMRSCFDSGGSPITHQELTENGNVSLKANRTYWTADFAVETQENIDHQSEMTVIRKTFTEQHCVCALTQCASATSKCKQTGERHSKTAHITMFYGGEGLGPQVSVECQYASVNFRTVSNCNTKECRSFKLENPEFGDCKTERGYICYYFLFEVYSLYAVPTNWNNSKHACGANLPLAKFGNQTQTGYIYGLENRLDVLTVWLDQVRTHDIQVVNNRNATDRLNITKHGTFNLHDGFKLIPSGKGYDLSAICVFENASIAEMNLISDCLEGHGDADVGEIVSSTASHINYILIASVSIATLMVSITVGVIVRCRNVNRRGKTSPPSNRVDIPLQPGPEVAAPEPEYVNRQELKVVVNSMDDGNYANHDCDETEHETRPSLECVYSITATQKEESTVQPRVTSNSYDYETASDAIL